MDAVTFRKDESTLYICLNGRIDTTNAAQAEQAVLAIRQANPEGSVVLDADRLDYISSAGLRVVLRLRKNEPDLKIINVSSEVYEVLDMTGFTDMIPVEKAYRRLSVEGCEVIGKGANGMIFRYDPETIVKIYYNPNALDEIRLEREMARKAFVLGINTAIPYGIVRVGDGYGTVTELLNATSTTKLIANDPDNLERYVAQYIDLLKTIHAIEVKPGDMPSMKDIALNWASFLQPYLPADQYDKLIRLVREAPDRLTVMHGDYHSNNVMVQNGEALLIDMDTLCYGHPVFELASMFNAFVGYSELDHQVSVNFFGFPHETSEKIWDTALRMYLNTDDEAVLRSVAEKAMIIGYTRMMRRTIRRDGLNNDEGRRHIARCKEQLAYLLSRVDTLDF